MQLPDELLVHILQNLDYRYLLRCCEVCKAFKAIIEGTAALQYTIELAVSGQRDNPLYDSASDSSKDKLERLKKHQQAWNALEPSREMKIPMSSGDLWELYGGVLAQSTAQGEIQFHQLPSDLRGVEEKQWTLPAKFGFPIRDFSMDPGQDLLVLVETLPWTETEGTWQYRIHFHTMSTGQPHPLATRSMLIMTAKRREPDMSVSVQVFGDLVGVQLDPVNSVTTFISLWNWKIGELLVDIYSRDLFAFTLLSDRWMLLAYLDEHADVRLGCVDFVREPSHLCGTEDLRTLIELECPPLSILGVSLEEIHLRADAGCFVDNRRGGAFLLETRDFVITLTSVDVRGRSRSAIQFISSRTLVDFLEAYPPVFRDINYPELMPDCIKWEVWVPQTRIRVVKNSSVPSDVWIYYVYGNRYIEGTPKTVEGVRGFEVEMLDFNQLALKRDAPSTGSKYPGFLKTLPTSVPVDKPYNEEVVTCLPYRSQSLFLKGVHKHCHAMCTEDAIVIADLPCKEYRVLVF